MNRKYMDFVPTTATKKKPAKGVTASEAKVEKPAVRATEPKAEPKAEMAKRSLNDLDRVKAKMNLPKPTFVNTEKVRKRPLSKNVYQKKVVAPKEETPSAPVTIINKPEKDSKVGLVVTIIITIILGAAAGTVAFLLLPK